MVASIQGSSMEPTYKNGNIKILYKRLPERGDVVITKLPRGWKENKKYEKYFIIKRVIAIPNDTLEIKDNVIYVNKEKVIDTSKYYTPLKDLKVVLKDSYFIMGDNTEVSFDSLRAYSLEKSNFLIKSKDIIYSRKEKKVER